MGVFTCVCVFFFKQKTAYEMRISDWSSDVCSSDLIVSLTVSAAGDLAERPAEEIATLMWRDTARALGLDPTPGASDQPVVRIVKEKRATLAQTDRKSTRLNSSH